jgi:hypothetical protein
VKQAKALAEVTASTVQLQTMRRNKFKEDRCKELPVAYV